MALREAGNRPGVDRGAHPDAGNRRVLDDAGLGQCSTGDPGTDPLGCQRGVKSVVLAHGLFVGSIVAIWALWLDTTGQLLISISARLPAPLAGIWSKIIRVYDEFRIYRHERRLLAQVLGQSIITLILTLASVYTLLL